MAPIPMGIDRTGFTFSWRYDNPDYEDDEFTVTADFRLAHESWPQFGAETTYFLPGEGYPFEGLTVTWDYHFVGGPGDLTVDEGYFSVREVDGEIQGGLYLETSGGEPAPSSLILGASFREPDPWAT